MSWKQVKPFDPAKGGTQPKLCLRNTRLGYDIPDKYYDAFTAWKHTQQHTDTPPAGIAVPVFFDFWATIDGVYANYGHVGSSLPDGRIWTDGRYYPDVYAVASQYLVNGKGKYLGWGEGLNDVKVIQESEELMDEKTVKAMYKGTLHRDPESEDAWKHWVGRPAYEFLDQTIGSDEWKHQNNLILNPDQGEYVPVGSLYIKK